MAQIQNVQELLTPLLGQNKKFLAMETSNLTVAGDNYGSSMLKVDINIENSKGETEVVHAVAKMLPQNEFVRKAFNSQFTYRNEIGFYEKIAPYLREFQKERGITTLYDSYPAFYGARLSLNPESTELDDDAVLLIKNIKYDGFTNVDRIHGFDLGQSKVVLEKMAELHATFMAFKAQKGEIFDRELSQFFRKFKIFDFGDDTSLTDKVIVSIVDIIKDDEFCTKHMEKIRSILHTTVSNKVAKNKEEDPANPFLSLVHSDMWTNNIMLKMNGGETVDVKFVDYQIYEYSSLTRDIIFFLFSSIQIEVVKQHLDTLLSFYYKSLQSWLEKLGHDTSPFTFEAFIDSIKSSLLEMEFFHIMIMLGPIYAEDQHVRQVEEMNEEAVVQQRSSVSDRCKEKGCYIVKDLITRGWI